MTTYIAKAFKHEDAQSLWRHTIFFNRPMLRAKLLLIFKRGSTLVCSEQSSMQVTDHVRLDPETERAL